MFSSSINLFSPNCILDYQKDNVHFNNYHQQIHKPFLSIDLHDDVTTQKQDFVVQQQFSETSEMQYNSENHDDLLDAVISSYNMKVETTKKDGHSKICTARGPRDRRVRLSIDIARKFFCLQDLLGFDKASKTLDWLFTKSLAAIKDLVEQTNHCSSEESKAKFLETIKGDNSDEEMNKKKPQRKRVDAKGKNLSREQSRAKARVRARERTKQKNRVKKLDDFEVQNGCEDVGWERVMDQESFNHFKDLSFQVGAFHEQVGDQALDLAYVDEIEPAS